MAYDNYLEDRIDKILKEKNVPFTSKKMMGGLCYMVNDKMCLGIVNNKLMARVGLDYYEKALVKDGVYEMDFTKRPMKGYIYVDAEVIDMDEDLEFWVDKCLAFNPHAKSSKKNR